MKYYCYILDRALRTRGAAASLTSWQWPERSLADWDNAIQSLRAARLADLDAETSAAFAKGRWDARLGALHALTSTVVRLGRVHWRASAARAGLFDFVKPDAKSRASIVGAAERLSALWQRLDAAWSPQDAVSLEAFDLLAAECAALKRAALGAEADQALARATLAEQAAALDEDCMAWYAAATAVFSASTTEGEFIRRSVPTTTVSQPPPEQAVMDRIQATPEGGIALEFSARHGTRFTVWHRPPGQDAWVVLALDTEETSVTLVGQPAGEHRFKVRASNSRGEGPESAEASLALAAAAA
jgi:hypothetical protein